jgi:hypothetical protein
VVPDPVVEAVASDLVVEVAVIDPAVAAVLLLDPLLTQFQDPLLIQLQDPLLLS